MLLWCLTVWWLVETVDTVDLVYSVVRVRLVGVIGLRGAMVAWWRYQHHHHRRRRVARYMKGLLRMMPATSALMGLMMILVVRLLIPGQRTMPKPATRSSTSGTGASARCDTGTPPPVRVYVHLHKTGGNTLKAALGGWARHNAFRAYHTCHDAIPDGWLSSLYFRRGPKPLNATDCNLDKFSSLRHEEREEYDLIYGHQHVGVHALMERRAVYFTFIRDPVSRKTSHYGHFESGAGADVGGVSLHDYLLHKNLNYQTKRLAPKTVHSEVVHDVRSRLVDGNRHAARAALSAALHNLNTRFFFVGVHERYRAGLCVLSAMLNDACWLGDEGGVRYPLRSSYIARMHLNRRGETERLVRQLTPSMRAAVYDAEYLDNALHRYATRRFAALLRRYPHCDIY